MFSCRGKTALVTNASHVTGRAAARALAKAGAQVLVHDDRSTAKVESVVQEIHLMGGVAKAITADISTAQGPHQLASQTRVIVGDRLDVLVVNASMLGVAEAADATVETFDTQYAVNTRAPFFLIQHLLPILSDGSSIICTSPSDAAEAPAALPAYLSTRDAVINLVAHFAPVLEARGIRINAITVDAAATTVERSAKPNEVMEEVSSPSGERRPMPEDLGAAITFLASSEASRLTGQTFSASFTKRRDSRRGKPAARRTGVGSHG